MNGLYKITLAVGIAVFLLMLFRFLPGSFDLTLDHRHQLTKSTIAKLESLNGPTRIDVFLSGKLPAQYQHFRASVEDLLNNFSQHTDQLYVNFIDPFEQTNPESIVEEMEAFGLPPTYINENNSSINKETVLFPWAIINQNEKSIRVGLLRKNLGDTQEQILLQSLQQLEYQFMDGLEQITLEEKENIAFLTSHETSPSANLADWIQSLQSYYNVASFDLKKKELTPTETLTHLNRFRLLVISNPKKIFSIEEKYILDQYQMQGGALLWLVDGIAFDENQLMTKEDGALIEPNGIGLDDFFFNNGIRIQQNIIKDLYCAPLILARGEAKNVHYLPYPWPYFPLLKAAENHPIGKDLSSVWLRYASSLDTIKNGLVKTVLLQSSPLTQKKGFPSTIQLSEAGKKLNPADYTESQNLIGVLLEGQFESLFKNRIKPFEIKNPRTQGFSKSIVISDGNFGENQLDKGTPLSLGFDKWSANFYDNKALLINSVHYLAGFKNLVEMRNKNFDLLFLDPIKVAQKASVLKLLVLLAPIGLLILLGVSNRIFLNKK